MDGSLSNLSPPSEQTSLLLVHPKSRTRRTPLPWGQLFILFWVQLAEPLSSMVIYPFINKMISELPITGGDEAKTGYYAGLIESLFSVTQAMTILYWSRLSDRIGRKPLILIGLAGVTLSMALFGISKTFGGLVFSRCLSGALNGNTGVIKSMMGEITDSTNVAQAMALMPVVWNTGATVAPIIGGWLSNPHEQFPGIFPGEFWESHPYALPCFVVAVYCAGTLIMTFFYLEESLKLHPTNTLESDTTEPHTPLTLFQVLTPYVRIAVINYTILAFLDIALRALQPLFFTASPSAGGLGFSVPTVGTCLAAFFVASGVYQAVAFAPLYEWLGSKRIYVISMGMFIPIFALFPMMKASAGASGNKDGALSLSILTWVELTSQIILYVIMDMGFSSALIYIRVSSPNAHSLGATNGLAQTAVAVARAVGPVSITSLFALSVEYNILRGSFVYVVFIVMSVGAVFAAQRLPETPRNDEV